MTKRKISKTDIKKKILIIVGLLVWAGVSFWASQFLVGTLFGIILGDKIREAFWLALCSTVAYALALFLVIFVPHRLFKKGKTDRTELGLRDLPTWTDIGLAPVGFVVYLVGAAALTFLFSFLPCFDATEIQNIGFQVSFSPWDRLWAFLALVIAAPVAEEVIFRGWLYGKLREKTGVVLSSILASMLFGALHGQWNVGVNVFAMSIVLCGLREVTGTIYSGILLHMIKNGVAFYLLYAMGMR